MSIIPQGKDYDQDLAIIMRALASLLEYRVPTGAQHDALLARADQLDPPPAYTGGDTHISASRGRRYG